MNRTYQSTALLTLAVLAACLTACHAGQADQPNPETSEAMTLTEHPHHPVLFRRDIPYAGTDNPRQRLDLYVPKAPAPGKLPVIVFIHGGAWMAGSKAVGGPRLAPLVSGGRYAAVSVGYRLTDQAIWPAQIHDCKAAVRWVRAHADEFNLDPDRIAAWGESAGAHLALLLGFTGDVPELEGDLGPHTDQGSRVSGVANCFGPTDFLTMIDQPSDIDRSNPNYPEALLIGGPVPDNLDKARAASPVTYVTPKDPPVLTLHGTADRIVPFQQARRLDEALAAAEVRHWFIPVTGAGHGSFPPEAADRTAAFFAKILLDEDVTIPTEPIE